MTRTPAPLVCLNCYARSVDSHDGWEQGEYGAICPECANDPDLARTGVETNGVAAIAELLGIPVKAR